MDIILRSFGNRLDLGPDAEGREPTPPELISLLAPHLTYTYKRAVRGHNQYAACGNRQQFDFEERRLFDVDNGRLCTGLGMLWTIREVLERLGHQVYYVDVTPPRPRPDCYVPDWDNCFRYVSSFRSLQLSCLETWARARCGVVKAPPGFGKTFMIKAFCLLYPQAKIHVVCKIVEVARRIQREVTAVIPNVGFIGDGDDHHGEFVTVITADSAHKSDGDADFLIGDEGHLLMAPRVSEALGGTYLFSRNFTLTATPEGRFDGADAKLEMFFGPVIFDLDYPTALAHGIVAPIRVRWLDINLPSDPGAGKHGVPFSRWAIWRNEGRNQIMADDVRANYGPDDQVLMMVQTIEHAVHLWHKLPEFWLMYANMEEKELESYKKSRLLPPGFVEMDRARRSQIRERFESGDVKKVISTDVWATGVSFDSLPTLYRADARDSVILNEQIPGRVSRIFDGKEYGELVECFDGFNEKLARKSRGRRRNYHGFGWVQQWPEERRL